MELLFLRTAYSATLKEIFILLLKLKFDKIFDMTTGLSNYIYVYVLIRDLKVNIVTI